jgi:hypothetical protein
MEGNEEFLIERLGRGSIINHNSFLMNDGIDTDAKCKTTVSIFYININTIKYLRQKHIELDQALTKLEIKLVNPAAKEPALDYIIKDTFSQSHYLKLSGGNVIHNYQEEEYRRKLTVKLKNAIMVYWLEVKKERSK